MDYYQELARVKREEADNLAYALELNRRMALEQSRRKVEPVRDPATGLDTVPVFNTDEEDVII